MSNNVMFIAYDLEVSSPISQMFILKISLWCLTFILVQILHCTQIRSGLGWLFWPLFLVFIQTTSFPFTHFKEPCSLTPPSAPNPLAPVPYFVFCKGLGFWTTLRPCRKPQLEEAPPFPLIILAGGLQDQLLPPSLTRLLQSLTLICVLFHSFLSLCV